MMRSTNRSAREGPWRKRLRPLVLLFMLVGVVAFTVAACGGDDSAAPSASDAGGGGGVEDLLAQAAVDAAQFTGEITAFTSWDPGPSPTPTAGLTIGNMSCLWVIPACKRISDSIDEAAKAIGWEPITVDGTAEQANQRVGMQSFLTANVAGIINSAIDPNGISDLLAEARDKDIGLVHLAGVDPRPFGGFGPSIDITGGLFEAGRQLGAWVANDTQNSGRVLIMSSTDNPALQERDAGFIGYLKRFPGIQFVNGTDVDPIYVPFADLGPPLQAQTSAILQANPAEGDLYIYTPFDGFATFVVQAAQELGRDDVKVVSFDGNPQNLDFIRNGTNQVATQATAFPWCAWLAVDQLNRQLGGGGPYLGGCPSKVIDITNLPPEGELFEGDIDFRAEFLEKWGRN